MVKQWRRVFGAQTGHANFAAGIDLHIAIRSTLDFGTHRCAEQIGMQAFGLQAVAGEFEQAAEFGQRWYAFIYRQAIGQQSIATIHSRRRFASQRNDQFQIKLAIANRAHVFCRVVYAFANRTGVNKVQKFCSRPKRLALDSENLCGCFEIRQFRRHVF